MGSKVVHTPKQSRSQKSVKSILDATVRLLEKSGYETLSTNGIAKEAGINIATLYRYFPNKESILASLLERHNEQLVEIVRDQMSRTPDRRLSITGVLESTVELMFSEPWLINFKRALAFAPDLAPLQAHADKHLIDTFLVETSETGEFSRRGYVKKEAAMQVLVMIFNISSLRIVDAPKKKRRALQSEVTRLFNSYLDSYSKHLAG